MPSREAAEGYDQARECLDQAVLVAMARPVDWSKIERWCHDEGPEGAAAFEDLKRLCTRG